MPKSRGKCLAILVEAVQALGDAREMKRDLRERTELLKKKCLVDDETRVRLENELSKIMAQDLEEARLLTIH